MTGNWAAGKERTRTGRDSGGPLLEVDLWGSSRACEMREGREGMSGEGRWEVVADLEGRFLDLPADRDVGCLSPSGSVPYPGSIVQTPTDAQAD
jgi:hypothetical protein